MSKFLWYETCNDKLKHYFGEKNLELLYTDTDIFVLSVNAKDNIKDLKILENIFDFNNLDENHELLSGKNEKIIGTFKIETPKKIWIDEFVCLRSKMYAFNCGDDSRNKLKVSTQNQSTNIKFEEYYNCLFGGKYKQERDNFIIR